MSEERTSDFLEKLERKVNQADLLMTAANGIVVDEAVARSTPCTCYEYREGRFICWSRGVIGSLTDMQEEMFCNPREVKEGKPPGRIIKFLEASDECIPPEGMLVGERLKFRLECMSRELAKRGIRL